MGQGYRLALPRSVYSVLLGVVVKSSCMRGKLSTNCMHPCPCLSTSITAFYDSGDKSLRRVPAPLRYSLSILASLRPGSHIHNGPEELQLMYESSLGLKRLSNFF